MGREGGSAGGGGGSGRAEEEGRKGKRKSRESRQFLVHPRQALHVRFREGWGVGYLSKRKPCRSYRGRILRSSTVEANTQFTAIWTFLVAGREREWQGHTLRVLRAKTIALWQYVSSDHHRREIHRWGSAGLCFVVA